MGENSAIEWTDHTMNFWIGCQEVSSACDFCYAKEQNKFRKWVDGWGPHGERRPTSDDNWKKLFRWNRAAHDAGRRDKVFFNSLSDFFDSVVPTSWREKAWRYIAACYDLDFLLLTKRPQNIAKMLPTGVDLPAWPWPNVWLGTTVENQEEADRRIPHLLAVQAKVRFLSCEPLLGPVDLTRIDLGVQQTNGYGSKRISWDSLTGWEHQSEPGHKLVASEFGRIAASNPGRVVHWVIGGGESGPNARPWHPNSARSLRDQCANAGVPFFWKQNGEWLPEGDWYEDHPVSLPCRVWDGTSWTDDGAIMGEAMVRLGKHKAGALLDGVSHKAMPA